MSATKNVKAGQPESKTQRNAEPYAVRSAREQIAILRAEMLNTLVHYTDAKAGLNIDEVSRTTIETMTLALSSLEGDIRMLCEGVSQ